MKKTIYLIAWTFAAISCYGQGGTYQRIEFKLDYRFGFQIQQKVRSDTVAWKYQLSAADYAAKGDYRNALIQWDLQGTSDQSFTKNEVDFINRTYSRVSAADYIVQRSKYHQVIIINEAHHNSLHRFFTRFLLQGLYDNGYRHLGLEALNNGKSRDSLLSQRGYPVQNSGFYTKDPQFGELIRTALAMGFHVFPYERTTASNGKQREIEQARNIQEVMKQYPGEKFLIHCGFSHVMEGTVSSWEKAMAGRLSEFTGIDPLTINQVANSEKSRPEYNNPFLKALNIQESAVLLDEQGNPVRYEDGESWADIAVFHPNTEYVSNRPRWLFRRENRSVELDVSGVDISFPLMVLAYRKGEDISQAVPADITEVEDRNETPVLALKKGTYDIVVVNNQGEAGGSVLEVR